MKFIRDIIAERADAKAPAPAPDLPPVTADPTPAPAPVRDRTMTRLTDGGMLDGDDVFKRLLEETAAPEADAMPPLAEPEPEPEADENLFDDLMDDHFDVADAVPDHPDPTPRMAARAPFVLDDPIPDPAPDPAPMPQAADPAMPPAPHVATPYNDETPLPPIPGRSPAPTAEPAADMVAVPAPAFGRSGRGAGRVKTRLLGFGTPEAPVRDPFADPAPAPAAPATHTTFPVGWLVVTAGPGRGACFTLQSGVSQIGRGEDQAIRLDFGDTSISRSNHAAIAYDSEQGGFYLGHGGKANMVRLNDRPVLSTEEITSGALIRIGETTLRFVALCDDTFSWADVGP